MRRFELTSKTKNFLQMPVQYLDLNGSLGEKDYEIMVSFQIFPSTPILQIAVSS